MILFIALCGVMSIITTLDYAEYWQKRNKTVSGKEFYVALFILLILWPIYVLNIIKNTLKANP